MIFEWSPVHLRGVLQKWFWEENRPHASALEAWHAMCDYLYLPRLKTSQVFENAIRDGAASTDYFGYASSVSDGRYEGFTFGRPATIHLDSESVLIEPAAATEWKAKTERPAESAQPSDAEHTDADSSAQGTASEKPGDETARPETAPTKKRFFGTVELDPIRAQMQFAEIQRELVHHLQTPANAKVRIRVDIEAENSDGYDESQTRTVRENARALGFGEADFDEE